MGESDNELSVPSAKESEGWPEVQGRLMRESWALTKGRPSGEIAPMVLKYWTVVAGLFGSLTWATGYFAIASFASGIGVSPHDLDHDSTSPALLGALGFAIAMIALAPFLACLWLTYRLGPWISSLSFGKLFANMLFLGAVGAVLWLALPALVSVFGVTRPGQTLTRSLVVVSWSGFAIGLLNRQLAKSQKRLARLPAAIALLMVVSLAWSTAGGLVADGRRGAERSRMWVANGETTEVFNGLLRYFVHPELGWVVLSDSERLCAVRVSDRVYLIVPDGESDVQTLVADVSRFESAAC